MSEVNSQPTAGTTERRVEVIAADIARELREHPEHWTKGADARDRHGAPTRPTDDDAVCWCVVGHVVRRIGDWPYEIAFRFRAAAGSGWMSNWNDRHEVSDVIALCDRLAGPGYGFAAFRAASLTALERTP